MGIETAIIAGGAGLLGSAIQGQAAKDAAKTQAQAGQAAIEAQQQATEQLRQDLAPFTQFGSSFLPQYQQQIEATQGLYGPNAGQEFFASPIVQDIINQERQKILQNQAISGRLGTGETPDFLTQSALRTSFGLLGQERAQQGARLNQFLSPIQIGQASAAQTGAGALQSGANIADITGSIGAAQAAGQIGQANAITGGISNLLTASQLGNFGGFGNQPMYPTPPSVPGVNTIPGMF